MIKFLTIFAMVFYLGYAQRPPYAGNSNRYPVVLPQYLEGRDPPTTTNSIGNRIDSGQDTTNRVSGSSGGYGGVAPAAPVAPSISTIPDDIPVDARGDLALIEQIKTWPREKQPFWFLNWQQIQEHRGDSNSRGQAAPAQSNTRPFFAG